MPGLGRKIFTAGDVLTASDVQNYLMDQSVMTFAGTAARSSAIATPTTGMTSYIGVTGTATIPQLETYTGSGWQTPYGLTLVASSTFTSAASVSIDNVFTTTYQHYKIIVNLTNASSAVSLGINMRASGSTNTTANYQTSNNFVSLAAGPSRAGGIGNSYFSISAIYSGGLNTYNNEITMHNPQRANYTTMTTFSQNYRGAPDYIESLYGNHIFAATTQFDGFALIPQAAQTITGTIQVYGLRNS